METVVERVELQTDLRKPYKKPQIIHELELETRAGSVIVPHIIDPLKLDEP
jgi:hypothetical protein